MGLLTLPGDPARRHGRRCAALVRAPARRTTRDLDEVADIYDSFKDPARPAAIRHVVRAVVDWRARSSPWPTAPTSPRRCRCA